MSARRAVTTVMFTDIVESTQRAAELGDHRWHAILERHNDIVRRALRLHHGREIATAGDGFLALFESPEHAIRCADSIRTENRELGLEIRCALHMGEVELSHGGVEGLAIHIGSRILGLAAPSEVLVSQTVRDTEAGSGIAFIDRGAHDLKGVPGPWRVFAVAEIPERKDLAEGAARLFGRRYAVTGAAIGIAILLATLFFLRQRERPADSGAMTPIGAAPGIAVVPFTVNGPDLDLWREGMVDLLATGLDGIGGLRAIDSRTVLARWRERVAEGEEPDLGMTLDVARSTGARYALLGSVVAIGPDVRLTADVYDTDRGEKLGQSQAAGPPDSILALVDRLAIDTARAIQRSDEEVIARHPDLASVTTGSLPALKAFLDGEARYRRSDFAGAITAFEEAVAIDSMFALAFVRLSSAYGWMENVGSEVAGDRLERAARLADNLPEREAAIVRADLALQRGSLDGIEPLRTAIRQYPDDPEAWYLLGDTYVHLGDQALVDEAEVGETLGEAVELDPSFAPYYIHLIERAVRNRDESGARRTIRTYGALAPGTTWDRRNRLAAELVFGAGGRALSDANLDTVATRVLWGVAGFYLWDPRVLGIQEKLLRRASGRSDAPQAAISTRIFFNLYNRGRYGAALRQLDDEELPPGFRSFGQYVLWKEGVRIGSSLDGCPGCPPPDPTPDDGSYLLIHSLEKLFAGAYAADRGEWNEHAAALRDLRTAARRLSTGRDSLSALRVAGVARGLEGYGLWKRGRAAQALLLLKRSMYEVSGHEPVIRSANYLLRWWLGTLLEERGRAAEAATYFESLWEYPLWNASGAAYRLGGIYAAQRRPAEARQAYMYALLAWRGADSLLQPRVADANRALSRLASEE